MFLLDASILISYFRENDENHKRAVELMQQLNDSCLITTLILSETITFIKKRDGSAKAKKIWKIISVSDIGIVDVKDYIEKIMYYVEKYQKLSFADAGNAAVMIEMGIVKIVSFDSDFDFVEGIERIY